MNRHINNTSELYTPSTEPESLEASPGEHFHTLVEAHRIDASSPEGRIDQLKQLDAFEIAVLLDAINRSVQGVDESTLVTEHAMKIGDTVTIHPSDRYDVFTKLITDIRNSPNDTHPARIGDALALGVVLLHPFKDGNGRTARLVGGMFRDLYDEPDFDASFATLAESRDTARERGGFMVFGYVPHGPDGLDRSDPAQVSAYLESILTQESDDPYVNPYGVAPLKKPAL